MYNQQLVAYAALMASRGMSPTGRVTGKTPTMNIVDELTHNLLGGEAIHALMDEAVRDGKVIVIDSMSMDFAALEQRIMARPVIEVPKCHATVWPEKQYGKKYRRLLRSGKR